VTRATKYGSCSTPPLARVAKPCAWSIGRISYWPMPIEAPVPPVSGSARTVLPSSMPPDHVSGSPVASRMFCRTRSAPTS
jgi:hypothetical protein